MIEEESITMEVSKVDLYFKECTQEILTLPITVPNCYYLGKFDFKQRQRLTNLLHKRMYSFKELEREVLNV